MNDAAPQTIAAMFEHTVRRQQDKPALGGIEDGRLEWLTWNELFELVLRRAVRLATLGVSAETRVVQLGANSVQWIINDLALNWLAAVHVPIHAAMSAQQVAELTQHSDARWAIVDVPETGDGALCSGLDDVRIVTSKQLSTTDVKSAQCDQAAGASSLEATRRQSHAESLATILYTSGSTGAPRGVMLTQRNLLENIAATVAALSVSADETRLCILPLSHIYARTCDCYCWIYRGSRLVLSESRDTIMRDCQIAKPTIISAVPYFYQRLADRLRVDVDGEQVIGLREALGGAVKHCFCGGAGASPDVESQYEQQGLPLLSGYGLTETSPVVTATAIGQYEQGSVGRPLANLDVRLAADGEILVRGPSVMQGYLDDPTGTSRAIRDGWFYTGDLGQWTDAGNLRIIGRKKETIVLSTGRKAEPTQIENRLLGSPLIEQACVVGDGQPFLGALIVPNADALRREIRDRRLLVWSRRRGLTHPKILALYRRDIDHRLASAADFEQIGAFSLLDRGFSLERGELTPKLSMRRDVIAQSFSTVIQRLFRRAPAEIHRNLR